MIVVCSKAIKIFLPAHDNFSKEVMPVIVDDSRLSTISLAAAAERIRLSRGSVNKIPNSKGEDISWTEKFSSTFKNPRR